MVNYFLILLLLVPGPLAGQRDLTVNRRARQKPAAWQDSQVESESSAVTAVGLSQLRLVPDHVANEDDSRPDFDSAALTPNRRRATDDRSFVSALQSPADEGDFILRRESDFGLRRNVVRPNGDSSQRSVSDAATVARDPVVPATSRRTGLPASRGRVTTARQREVPLAEDLDSRAGLLRQPAFDRIGEEMDEDEEQGFTNGPSPALTRQRLRQVPPRAEVAATEEPSARVAAAEGQPVTATSIRARAQLQRIRTVPPEAPLAVALPRSGHSANVDSFASQQAAVSSRSRSRSRLAVRPDAGEAAVAAATQPAAAQSWPAAAAIEPEARISSRGSGRSLETSRRSDTVSSSPNQAGSRVKFPKKNLIPGLPKVIFNDEKKSAEAGAASSRNRVTKPEIKPTRTRPEPSRRVVEEPQAVTEDYRNTDIQSTKEEPDDVITVTHQVQTQTVFTVLDSGHVRSLYIDTFTPSYQIVAVSELKSTYIEESPVIFAHMRSRSDFGIQETLYDAIHPTRTEVTLTTSLLLAGARIPRETTLLSTTYSTIYNVQTITQRHAEPSVSLTPDIGHLGSLIQNVILGLLGGSLLGGGGGAGLGNPLLVAPQTRFITHTRSFLTTTTTMSTVLLPVTFRGSEVVRTVTETHTQISTATDVSVQTVIDSGQLATSKPFLPLAPTLHRATRVVPSLPTFPALLPSIQPLAQPATILHTSTTVTTLSTDLTSDIVITLGGREVKTQYLEPATKVLTLTSYSTETVTVPQPTQPSLERLALLRAILNLNSFNNN